MIAGNIGPRETRDFRNCNCTSSPRFCNCTYEPRAPGTVVVFIFTGSFKSSKQAVIGLLGLS